MDIVDYHIFMNVLVNHTKITLLYTGNLLLLYIKYYY